MLNMRGMQGKGETFKIENKGFLFFEVRTLGQLKSILLKKYRSHLEPIHFSFMYGLCTLSRL